MRGRLEPVPAVRSACRTLAYQGPALARSRPADSSLYTSFRPEGAATNQPSRAQYGGIAAERRPGATNDIVVGLFRSRQTAVVSPRFWLDRRLLLSTTQGDAKARVTRIGLPAGQVLACLENLDNVSLVEGKVLVRVASDQLS